VYYIIEDLYRALWVVLEKTLELLGLVPMIYSIFIKKLNALSRVG
jgi:hypothetical protein